MLITIIFITILIASIVVIIISEKKDIFDDDHFGLTIPTLTGLIVGICGIFGCSLSIIIAQNSLYKRKTRNSLEQKIVSLNATKTMIMKNVDDKSIVEITNYNTKVAEFKENIANQKMCRKNLWINWFTSSIYDEYTGNELEYIEA